MKAKIQLTKMLVLMPIAPQPNPHILLVAALLEPCSSYSAAPWWLKYLANFIVSKYIFKGT